MKPPENPGAIHLFFRGLRNLASRIRISTLSDTTAQCDMNGLRCIRLSRLSIHNFWRPDGYRGITINDERARLLVSPQDGYRRQRLSL